MTTYYVDTSALAKRYLREVGSAWVRSLVLPSAGNAVAVCDLTAVEMFSLLETRRREGSLSAADTTLLEEAFLIHAQTEYMVVAVDHAVLARARALLQRHPLRTLDAIQLACAAELGRVSGNPVTFVSADRNLHAAAGAEGLNTDDPNSHP